MADQEIRAASDGANGIHVSFEMHLSVEQLAAMPPRVVAVLMKGVADIVTAREFAREFKPPSPSSSSER